MTADEGLLGCDDNGEVCCLKGATWDGKEGDDFFLCTSVVTVGGMTTQMCSLKRIIDGTWQSSYIYIIMYIKESVIFW